MPSIPDPLLTVKEVATVYRVNPRTVLRWAKNGLITPVITPGGRLRRFRAADVEAALATPGTSQNESGPALAITAPDEPLVSHP